MLHANPFFNNIILWKCFIDYIFVLFKGIGVMDEFVNWLNNIHPSIKFVGSFNKEQINFLDTYRGENFPKN